MKSPARRKTPTVLQFEAVECGAASLGIILGYHGKFVPLEELRMACGVSRDGSKAINILRAARRYGLRAEGWKKGIQRLRELEPPYVVFWRFSHFLVVEGIDGDRVHVNDPARGPWEMSWEAFDEGYTGVALVFEPGPDFRPGGEPRSLGRALKRRLAGMRTAVLYLVAAGFLLVFPGILTPVFQKIYLDWYVIQKFRYVLVPLFWCMAVTLLVAGGLTWLQHYYLLRAHLKLSISTAGSFVWHILRLPVSFFHQRFCGEIGSRVGLNVTVASILTGKLATTVVHLLLIVLYLPLLLSYEWRLTLVGIGIASANLAVLRWVSRKRVDENRRLLQEKGRLTGSTLSSIQIMETVKSSGLENVFFSRFSGHQAKVVQSSQALGAKTILLNQAPVFLSSLNGVAILCLGAYDVIQGYLSIGTLVAFQVLMATFIRPFKSLVSMGSLIQTCEGDMNRLEDVLASPCDPGIPDPGEETRRERGAPERKLEGRLELKGLTFGYSPLEAPLIEDFSLAMEPGQRVAVVGEAGSGKSTLAKLVCGLYKPWAGEILFDGLPRERLPRSVLVNSLSHVSQEMFFFEGTVRENLTLWDPGVPDEVIVQAARDACIHDDVVQRPGGYEGPVAEGGLNFSGGQRQRLEVARALVPSPSLLVLDEATSALDPAVEHALDLNLRKRGCTCLIIAHRLSTVRDADEIIVLHEGKVVERGTHETLKESGGIYADLIRLDAKRRHSSWEEHD